VRPTRFSIRTGALAIAVGTLAAGALLTAPATQAAPPAATPASAGTVAVTASGPQGGDAVYTDGGWRCVLGFNVRDSSNVYYFLVSAHCGGGLSGVWYANSSRTVVLGNTVSGGSPGSDFLLVKYANQTISRPGTVDLYNGSSQDILTAANAYIGEPVKRSGSTTGVHSGTVTAVNATVTYADGTTLTGLIKTNVCAESGDTGGPLFDGTKAIGLFVSGSGNCSSGGTTYYRPVTQVLAVYGVNVY
jgi:hypothetical protein